jgi:CheY-like chemotaxis protein
MRCLFVDDDVSNVEFVASTLRSALSAEVIVVPTVEEAVLALHAAPVDVLVLDLFIPLGARPQVLRGVRARKYEDTIEHLGGLVILDELDYLDRAPVTLLHTACRDHVLFEVLGDRVHARVRKPAPAEVLLEAVLAVIRGE